ncbi:MAG: ice-binding family protein [Coriobacteriia bacterium]|nr:ice-binding family protein [Coriobacteriia bacterium]
MRMTSRIRFMPVALAFVLILVFAVPAVGFGAEAPVGLGTAGSYAVLAGSTVTNTGPSVITGDVGLHPGTAVVGFPPGVVNAPSVIHATDAAALQAKADLVTAYNDAAGRPMTADLTGQDLGGLTLTSGVYRFSSSAQLTGNLTLDAQGDPDAVFIFQIGTTLTTASNSSVSIINGGRFCRVFWQVGSSATLGTGSLFSGHIFAMQSVTANTSAGVEGQLLARNGAVTLDTNVITNAICATTRGIAVTKTAAPSSLPAGAGTVTYTYRVTNPGIVALTGVVVTDDKLATLTFVSGDTDDDAALDPGETWTYTATTRLTATTTNVATAVGSANATTTAATATETVVVGTGGLLPDTATPWYNVLLLGIALALLGVAGLTARRIYG